MLNKLKLNDVEAFDEVFKLYHKKLFYYVISKTNSDFYAEEIVQLTFIKLWQYRHSLNSEIPLSSQIFRIAKTTLIDQFRKSGGFVSPTIDPDNVMTMSDFNRGPENLFEQDILKQLKEAVATMPPLRKKVFEMSRIKGMTHKEIAAELSISVKTVENHINLALKQVRSHISPWMLFIFLFPGPWKDL